MPEPNDQVLATMREILATLLETPCDVVDANPVRGGCISQALCVTVTHDNRIHRKLFLKRNEASFLDNFECESFGLAELSSSKTIRVPNILAVGRVADQACLVSEWIAPTTRPREFFETFGRRLAEMHQATAGTKIGWHRDNYLGAARQVNTDSDAWVDFVALHRIGFQLRWAIDQGQADQRLRRDVETIIRRIPDLLDGRADETSLLHGDLWSGNYLCDAAGNPVIIDPAVYRGCREAEFGMIRLFGSCPPVFDEAYQETFPMPDGCRRRVSVYVLYHLLNHLNLFGSGYLGQCHAVAAEILQH